VIGRLHGTLLEHGTDSSCLIDVGGVGYEVYVPLGAVGRLPKGNVTLHIHTHVREDALTLYGFASSEDRAAFRALLGVSSVGPKVALAILGTFSAPELAILVAREDVAAFKAISGVGKKTAERLIIDLRDKLPKLGLGTPSAAPQGNGSPASPQGPEEEVVRALVAMGYRPAEAERAVKSLPEDGGEKPLEQLLRDALVALAK
jgi:Holliday junction DNA helicase RuvA